MVPGQTDRSGGTGSDGISEYSKLAWICLGGAAGSGARYLVSAWMARLPGTGFPYGTLTVNVAGSFLLALILQISLDTDSIPPAARLALTTGVMGGFTTYSTFNYETFAYMQEHDWGLAILNIGITVIVCLAAAAAGYGTARYFTGG